MTDSHFGTTCMETTEICMIFPLVRFLFLSLFCYTFRQHLSVEIIFVEIYIHPKISLLYIYIYIFCNHSVKYSHAKKTNAEAIECNTRQYLLLFFQSHSEYQGCEKYTDQLHNRSKTTEKMNKTMYQKNTISRACVFVKTFLTTIT